MLLLAFSPRGLAEAKSDVAVHLTAKKVVITADKESLESAKKAKPGDLIQYEAVYKNTSQAAVKNLQATVPLPPGLAFAAESAKPATAEASSDGKIFQPIPLTREVKKADGTIEQQPVPLSEYRALRWTVADLPAGASTTVIVRARVLTNAPAR
jgi:uncharacterized repeat protein (TIGR01451 family)